MTNGTTPPPGGNGGTTPPPGGNGGTTPPPGGNGGTTPPPGNGTTPPPTDCYALYPYQTFDSDLYVYFLLCRGIYPLSGSALTIPFRTGWTRGYEVNEVQTIIDGNDVARAIVRKAGGVQSWITLTNGGRLDPAIWFTTLYTL